MPPVYSLILPIFNEEAVLPVLLHRLDALLDQLDGPAEVIFVDDGSHDASPIVLEAKARADRRYRFVKLSRNFGQQAAMTTGLDHASGKAVVVMDADLQDPPEVVLKMVAKWKEGFEVVYAQRLTRDGDSWFKRVTADLFYRLLGHLSDVEIPRNVGDFRLVDRKALDSFLAMPERDRFVRGMFSWVGFRQAVVQFHRPARAAGETKYSLTKMVRLAASGLVSFSDAPLRLALWGGLGVCGCAALYAMWVVCLWLSNANLARGWSSIIIVMTFLGGANMLMTGVLGVYIGRIYTEVKRRPLYVVDRAIGFETAAEAAPARKSAPAVEALRA
jgi:glycosyltransferase involved in cell wall biosynthesis